MSGIVVKEEIGIHTATVGDATGHFSSMGVEKPRVYEKIRSLTIVLVFWVQK